MKTLRFHEFRLEPEEQRLWSGSTVVDLRPKTFAVLQHLAERAGRLVRNEELHAAVWEDAAVTPGTLNTSIRELRKALGDDARQPTYIETVHRRGFRFVATVRSGAEEDIEEKKTVRPFPMELAPPTSALHGREHALDQMEARLDSARLGRRQLVFVTGDVGIGKTSLLRAFIERHGQATEDGSLRVARGQCVHRHGDGEAYHPVLDALERWVRAGTTEQLASVMIRFAPTWALQLPWLFERDVLGQLRETVSDVTTSRMLREFCGLVETLTEEQPLILWLEDMHWSDSATIDLVGALARRSDPARLLLVATYRPLDAAAHEHPVTALHRRLRQERAASELPLPPLCEADVLSYLCERFTWSEAPSGLAAVIHEQTDGNPLLMVTLTSHLVSNRSILRGDNAWRLEVTPASIAASAPEGLGAIVDEQLESLGRRERETLEIGSVVGESFAIQNVAAALGVDDERIAETCARLARRGQFLEEIEVSRWPDGTVARRFNFLHAAFRRILYGRVAPARRQQLHLRIAERTEAAFATDSDAQAVFLAAHYEQGGALARAVEHLARAAAMAGRRFQQREAAGYARRAIGLLAENADGSRPDRRESELRLQLGRALAALSLRSADASFLDRCLKLSHELRDAQLEPRPERLELEYSKAMVDAAMERLPGEQREAVRLHYLSGLSCAEIARQTGTPQPTVASHLLQGLHRLSAALEKPSEVLP